MAGFDGSELNDEKDDRAREGAIEEPKDSERFISGGESSEETERRWVGGVLSGRFDMTMWGFCAWEGFAGAKPNALAARLSYEKRGLGSSSSNRKKDAAGAAAVPAAKIKRAIGRADEKLDFAE
jgi:hypothetical protein